MRRLLSGREEEREARTMSRYRPPVVILRKSQFNDPWSTSQNNGYRNPVPLAVSPRPVAASSLGNRKHASLWVMIANRYFVEIELQNQEPKQLQEWVKRIDLKKLAGIK